MLTPLSQDFRKKFLLSFTEELIRNSASTDIFRLKQIVKEENKEIIQEIKKDERKFQQEKRQFEKSIANNLKRPLRTRMQISAPPIRKIPQVLRIPEPRLPQRLQYLQPTPKENIEIDLGKLNILIKDPMVNSIECNAPNDQIIVQGQMGIKPTNIALTKEEITEIINEFSQRSKIPAGEGLYRVAVGKLIFSAIISEVISPKFIIKKMRYSPLRKNY